MALRTRVYAAGDFIAPLDQATELHLRLGPRCLASPVVPIRREHRGTAKPGITRALAELSSGV